MTASLKTNLLPVTKGTPHSFAAYLHLWELKKCLDIRLPRLVLIWHWGYRIAGWIGFWTEFNYAF